MFAGLVWTSLFRGFRTVTYKRGACSPLAKITPSGMVAMAYINSTRRIDFEAQRLYDWKMILPIHAAPVCCWIA